MNFNTAILAFFFLGILIQTGCGKCNSQSDTIKVSFSDYIHKIFNVYRPGSYFLYVNQDSTKYDSIYISNYNSYIEYEKEVSCRNSETREFFIISSFFSEGRPLKASYFIDLNNSYSIFALKSITNNGNSDVNIAVYGKDNQNYLFKPIPTEVPYEKYDNYILWKNPNIILDDVSIVRKALGNKGDVYFSAYLGIAKFITYDFKDTFKLYKNYVP